MVGVPGSGGGGNARDDGIEQRVEPVVFGRHAHTGDAPAVPGDCRDDRELYVVVGGVEVEEELIHGVDDFGDPGVRPVDLVDHQHCRQVQFHRLCLLQNRSP